MDTACIDQAKNLSLSIIHEASHYHSQLQLEKRKAQQAPGELKTAQRTIAGVNKTPSPHPIQSQPHVTREVATPGTRDANAKRSSKSTVSNKRQRRDSDVENEYPILGEHAEPTKEGRHMRVWLRDTLKNQFTVYMNPHERFGRGMGAYTTMRGINVNVFGFRFLYYGSSIRALDTPDALGLEDVVEIDVLMEQGGS